MKILIDTNVLFSAILFENSVPAEVVRKVEAEHEMFLTDQNLAELREVVRRKIPGKKRAMEKFLKSLDYKIIKARTGQVEIRDAKDSPIINAAAEEGIDMVITGDKDFLALNLKKPKCVTPAEFIR